MKDENYLGIHNGNFSNKTKTKYCLVGGYGSVTKDKNDNDVYYTEFRQALGTYKNMTRAFGAAYLYLSGFIVDYGKVGKWHVSAPHEIGDDTGYALYIEKDADEEYNKYKDTYDFVWILWDHEYKKEKKNDKKG